MSVNITQTDNEIIAWAKRQLAFGKPFCVYAFFHEHINTKKEKLICCESYTPITEQRAVEIRTEILQERPVPECATCYLKEDNKTISARQFFLRDFLRQPDTIVNSIRQHLDGKIPDKYSYDLRYSNLCNLECIMCNSESSSSIAKAQGIDNPILNYEIEDFDINPEVRRIYFAGGEPFMIKSYVRLLERVTNLDCEVIVNTNCTILTEPLMAQLDRFKRSCFHVSIEGYGRVNERIRKNSIWYILEDNLKTLIKRYGSDKITVNTVVQRDNVNHLYELGKFLEDHQIGDWKLDLIESPKELQVATNPDIKFDSSLLELPLIKNNVGNMLEIQRIQEYAKKT